MGNLMQVLPIVIYILLIGLIIVGIILGIKLITTISKFERIVDNVEDKVNALNGIFEIISTTSNKINGVYQKIVDILASFIERIFLKNSESEDEEDE